MFGTNSIMLFLLLYIFLYIHINGIDLYRIAYYEYIDINSISPSPNIYSYRYIQNLKSFIFENKMLYIVN